MILASTSTGVRLTKTASVPEPSLLGTRASALAQASTRAPGVLRLGVVVVLEPARATREQLGRRRQLELRELGEGAHPRRPAGRSLSMPMWASSRATVVPTGAAWASSSQERASYQPRCDRIGSQAGPGKRSASSGQIAVVAADPAAGRRRTGS